MSVPVPLKPLTEQVEPWGLSYRAETVRFHMMCLDKLMDGNWQCFHSQRLIHDGHVKEMISNKQVGHIGSGYFVA